jgi:energy-coupling factor transporter ATP-binding protein EcfA2
LEDIKLEDFNTKSESIKEYLKNENFDKDIIVLPNIFYTDTIRKERFKKFFDEKNQFIKMVNRKSIVDDILKDFLESEKAYYVYGPQGCGKSFVVYQLAARLMKNENNFVVYINKAVDEEILLDIVSILEAKLKSIGANLERIFRIIKAQDFDQVESECTLAVRFVGKAVKEIKQLKKQNTIFVIDQVNNLKDTEYSIAFLTQLKVNNICLFAGSANNSPNKFETNNMINSNCGDKYFENLVRFSERNFRALCKFYGFEFDPIEREQIMSTTGSVAIELNEFLSTFCGDSTKKINIRDSIQKYMVHCIDKKFNFPKLKEYFNKIEANEKQIAIDNVYKMQSTRLLLQIF